MIDGNKNISISAIMGDAEAFSLAKQIEGLLLSNNIRIQDGVAQSIFSEPVIGVVINATNTEVQIIVGAHEE